MQLATWLKTPSLHALELAKQAGFSIVVLDLEHGFQSAHATEPVIALARALGLTIYARVGLADRLSLQLALDFGADGVIIPQIEDVNHARAICACAKYPPLGSRGLGGNRTMNYGGVTNEFLASENGRVKCFPMIESPGALRDAQSIAALECVDGLFIGPGDLSLSRGRGNFVFSEDDRNDFAKVVEASMVNSKPWSTAIFEDGVLEWCAKQDCSFGVITSEISAIRSGFRNAFDAATTALSQV